MPIQHYVTKTLLEIFTIEFIKELKNELSFHYTSNQVEMIFNFLSEMKTIQPCSYNRALKLIDDHCDSLDKYKLLKKLFFYSIIGSHNNGYIQFKFRNPEVKFDKDKNLIIHNTISLHLQNI